MNLTGTIYVPTWNNYLYTLIIVEINCYYLAGYWLKQNENISIVVHDIIIML